MNRPLPRALMAVLTCALVAAPGIARAATFETVHEPTDAPGTLAFRATYRLWIPDGEAPLRGLVVHQHGCGEGAAKASVTAIDDLHWRALAAAHGCGLLAPTYEMKEGENCRLWCDPRNGSDAAFLAALDDLAKRSGRPEVATVPWALWGHSGGGFWSTIMLALHPERIAAIWLRSGSCFVALRKGEIAPVDYPAAAFGVPMMSNPGLKERGDKRFNSAWTGGLDTVAFFRARNAPVGFVPDPLTGHECGDSRYLAIAFLDAMLAERLPQRDAAAGLVPIDASAGLVAPLDANGMPGVLVPAAVWNGPTSGTAWLPDEAFAEQWARCLRDGFIGDTTPPPVPREGRAAAAAAGGATLTWQADADLETGLAGFVIRRDGVEVARLPRGPVPKAGRAVFQGITHGDTPLMPLALPEWTDPEGRPGTRYAIEAVNVAGGASAPLEIVVP
jgi:pimeloyl-ACP methyl ester carboxylesterase